MGRSSIFSSYLQNQKMFKVKWIEFHNSKMIFDESHYVDELTPLYGSDIFFELSIQKRHRLFFEYTKLVAESLVLFEQVLVFGVRHLRKEWGHLPKETSLSLHQFALEELYHSQGFRHFLYSNSVFEWKENKIFSDSRRLKNTIAFIIKMAPASIFLPGAKLEAFTLSYYRMIKKYYPSNMENSWIHLNHIHQIDEAFHLPLEFDLHDSLILQSGLVRTLFGTILFTLLMQVALVKGSYLVIRNTFPEFGFLKRLHWMLLMARWAVRTTPAYQEARQMTKQQFKKKKPKWGRLFAFVYW